MIVGHAVFGLCGILGVVPSSTTQRKHPIPKVAMNRQNMISPAILSSPAVPSPPRTTRSSLSKTSLVKEPALLATAHPLTTTKLSARALGKLPERRQSASKATKADQHPSDPPIKSAQDPSKLKKKQINGEETKRRVLPARTRRTGTGVGSSAVDAMIMESQRRTAENKYILPPTASFLVTTDSKLVPGSSTSGQGHQSYFDQPEVIESAKRQAVIQTPEFHLLSEGSAAGSRLRARAVPEELDDTSDAAYIRRHRRYEAFEKRQRLREKEKLEYEHYKLRERIDELKAMDASAFMIDDLDPEDSKRLMLKEAEELDRRYTVLLPGHGERKGLPSATQPRGRKSNGVGPLDDGGSLSDYGGPSIRLRLKRGKGLHGHYGRDSEEVENIVDGVGISLPHSRLSGRADLESGDDVDHPDSEGGSRPRRRVNGTQSDSPSRKRIRVVSGLSEGSAGRAVSSAPTVPILLQYAQASKAVSQPNAPRKLPPRHPLAFGVPMPASMDAEKEYTLPRWIVRDVEITRDEAD